MTSLAPCCRRPFAYCTCSEDKEKYMAEKRAEGFCLDREDATHCRCWWDGEKPCCSCGDDSVTLVIPGHHGSFHLDATTREFRKTATIRAVELTEPCIVKSMEGDHRGRPGDWLAQGPEGELWVIAGPIFAKTYEPVPDA